MHTIQNSNADQSSFKQASQEKVGICKNGQPVDINQTPTARQGTERVRELSREEAERNIPADQDPDDPVSP